MLKVQRRNPYDIYKVFEKKEFERNGYILKYRIYVPKNYDCGEMYPLVLFLHGAGERGDDNTLQLKNVIQVLFDDPTSPIYDSIVIVPQCPEGKMWVNADWEDGCYSIAKTEESEEMKCILGLLDECMNYYNVDPDRVYVTGISMGGFGTWDLLSRHGARFAAGMPVCGGGDPSYAKLLTRIPIRTFHGSEDGAVPVTSTRKMFAAIKREGGEKITYTELDGWDHGIWDHVYSDRDNIDWLFSQTLTERRKTAEKNSLKKKLVAAGSAVGLAATAVLAFIAHRKITKKSGKGKK